MINTKITNLKSQFRTVQIRLSRGFDPCRPILVWPRYNTCRPGSYLSGLHLKWKATFIWVQLMPSQIQMKHFLGNISYSSKRGGGGTSGSETDISLPWSFEILIFRVVFVNRAYGSVPSNPPPPPPAPAPHRRIPTYATMYRYQLFQQWYTMNEGCVHQAPLWCGNPRCIYFVHSSSALWS